MLVRIGFTETQMKIIDHGLQFLRSLNSVDFDTQNTSVIRWHYDANEFGEIRGIIERMVADIYGEQFAREFMEECLNNGEYSAWNERVLVERLLYR